MEQEYVGIISQAKFGMDDNYPYLFGLKIVVTSENTTANVISMVNFDEECVWNSIEEKRYAEIKSFELTHEILEAAGKSKICDLVGAKVKFKTSGNLCTSITFSKDVTVNLV